MKHALSIFKKINRKEFSKLEKQSEKKYKLIQKSLEFESCQIYLIKIIEENIVKSKTSHNINIKNLMDILIEYHNRNKLNILAEYELDKILTYLLKPVLNKSNINKIIQDNENLQKNNFYYFMIKYFDDIDKNIVFSKIENQIEKNQAQNLKSLTHDSFSLYVFTNEDKQKFIQYLYDNHKHILEKKEKTEHNNDYEEDLYGKSSYRTSKEYHYSILLNVLINIDFILQEEIFEEKNKFFSKLFEKNLTYSIGNYDLQINSFELLILLENYEENFLKNILNNKILDFMPEKSVQSVYSYLLNFIENAQNNNREDFKNISNNLIECLSHPSVLPALVNDKNKFPNILEKIRDKDVYLAFNAFLEKSILEKNIKIKENNNDNNKHSIFKI